MYMQNYKDILVYKTYRINLDNKLEAYNIFDNTKTHMRACKAIDEYLKTKDRDKLKTDIDSAVKSEQYARFEYESIVTDLIGNKQFKIDTYQQFAVNLDMFVNCLVGVLDDR